MNGSPTERGLTVVRIVRYCGYTSRSMVSVTVTAENYQDGMRLTTIPRATGIVGIVSRR